MDVSYIIHPAEFDPAPGRGYRPPLVGLRVMPATPLTIGELRRLIEQLEGIAIQMQDQSEAPTRQM